MCRFIVLITLLLLVIEGCSTTGDHIPVPTTPEGTEPMNYGDHSPGRFILAVGTFQINSDTLETAFLPDREALAHYNATPYLTPPKCDDCIIIEVLEFKPAEKYVKLKVAIKNPTKLTVYDVRGIVVSNADGMHLLNADSYTDLWDDGGDVTINPFKGFATDWPQREILPNTGHARIYEIEYPTFADLLDATLVFDASWPSNCIEPYEIRNPHTTGVFLDNTPQDILCEVLSWNDDVELVTVDLTSLGLGDEIPMFPQTGNWWAIEDVSWQTGGYEPGEYPALISAKCAGSILYLYNYVEITIEKSPPPPSGWARTWGGEDLIYGSHEWAYGVATDDSGNIYVAGCFYGTADFDPGPGVDEHTSNGFFDIFLSKFNSYGEFQWAKTWGGEKLDGGKGVGVDDSGSIYIACQFKGTVDFDPGPGVDVHVSISGSPALSKFNSDGDFLWARAWYGSYTMDIAVDGFSNVYVGGSFGGSGDFDPGPGVDEHSSNGNCNVYLSKFDSNGDFQWARTWGGTFIDNIWGVAADDSGNAYATGEYYEYADFDPGPGTDEHTTNGFNDAFLSKFNPDGDFQWAKTWGGQYNDGGYGVTVDYSDDVYVTGLFDSTTDFDPGPGVDEHTPGDIPPSTSLSKFHSNGDYQWVRIWDMCFNRDVTADNSNNVFITGSFINSVDFDPGPGVDEHQSFGYSDVFVAKLYQNGDYQWTSTWGGSGGETGCRIAVDDSGSLYVAGYFRETADFDPGPGVDEHTALGNSDIFLSKLLPDGYW